MLHLDPNRKPLFQRAITPSQKFLVVLLALACMVVWGFVVNKSFGSTIQGGGGGAWHEAKARHNPIHTVKTYKRNKYGDLVPHYVRGHTLCPTGYFAAKSKYTGISCMSSKQSRHRAKVATTCAGDTFIGWWFGGGPGASAVLAGCVWHAVL
jgi:hypothetical protein